MILQQCSVGSVKAFFQDKDLEKRKKKLFHFGNYEKQIILQRHMEKLNDFLILSHAFQMSPLVINVLSFYNIFLSLFAILDGLFLMEIDRVLRPGGYWVLSGPPINWRAQYKGWERTPRDLENEQQNLEDLARKLCWKKIKEMGPIAVWQKPTNHIHCAQKLKTWKAPKFCVDADPDAGW